MSNNFRIRQEFLSIVFGKVVCGNWMLRQFQDRFQKVLIFFLYHVCFYIDLDLILFDQGLCYQRILILKVFFFETLSILLEF